MYVPGEGPLNTNLLLCGEAPGRDEDAQGRPFCGVSGRELTRYLSQVRIDRDRCYVTNLVKLRPPNNSDPTPAMIAEHEGELCRELLTIRPRFVATLGRYSLNWFLPAARLEREWGIAHKVALCGRHGWPADRCWTDPECGRTEQWSVTLVAVHHPAFGLYKPEEQKVIGEGFERLAKVMRGELPDHPPIDAYPSPLYADITDADELPASLAGARVIAIDTEGSAARPWCLSFSVTPGEAYVIRATEKQTLAQFARWLSTRAPLVVLHYAAHDLEVLAALGVDVDALTFADTMEIHYLLGPHYPQALKMIGYRFHGMVMRDYEDVIANVSREYAVRYLQRVLDERRCGACKGEREVVSTTHLKNGKVRRSMKRCETCDGDGTTWRRPDALAVWENGKLTSWQPSSPSARARRILADVAADKRGKDGEPTDPRERWEDADPPEAIAEVVDVLGEMPRATLADVPLSESVPYACADADATLRTWLAHDPLLDEWGLREVYEGDLAITRMVVRMQQVGMEVDVRYFEALVAEWSEEMREVAHTLRRTVGVYVNPSSSKQVASLLFGKLRLPPVKLTKSKLGESTDDRVIEQLLLGAKEGSVERGVLVGIARYRELHKLVGTYARPLSEVR